MEEETTEETISVPPTVSEDAPSEPSTGEGPSASQPQPVYPDGEPGADAGDDASSTDDASADTMSDEASSDVSDDDMESSSDDSLSSQPQPVYPDGKPDGL